LGGFAWMRMMGFLGELVRVWTLRDGPLSTSLGFGMG
jgi:hypothetical protein